MRQNGGISNHILPTSSNMVGICMTVISLMQLLPKDAISPWADRVMAIDSLLFLSSTMFSYRALRDDTRAEGLEKYADWLFLSGMGIMVLAGVLVAFELFLA